MNQEVTQPTDDELWNQVNHDRSTTAEGEATPEGEVDPLAGIPEPTRKLIEGLQAKTAEYETRLHDVGQKLATAHGTMGSMKQQLDASRITLEKIAPSVAAAEAAEKVANKAKADELALEEQEILEQMEAFPEFKKYVDLQTAKLKPVDAKPIDAPQTTTKELSASEERLTQLTAERMLSDLHPGWIPLTKSQEYGTWRAKQMNVRETNPRDSMETAVSDAAELISKFKEHQTNVAKIAQVEKDRQERLRRSESVQGRGSSTGDVDISPDALWNKITKDRANRQSV